MLKPVQHDKGFMEDIQKLLHEKNTLTHTNQGILIAKVTDSTRGLVLAQEILPLIVDTKTLLLLSGGRTPKELYTTLAREETIQPGAVGLIDERYAEKFHQNSNETMIRDSGLLRYFEMRGIPFYPIINLSPRHSRPQADFIDNSQEINRESGNPWIPDQVGDDSERTKLAIDYDTKFRDLLFLYHKTVGILGIGLDGHTAGIPAQQSKVKIENAKLYKDSDLVMQYDDKIGTYGERVTLTFLGLEHLDFFMVLVFGEDKKEALDEVFSEGKEQDIPGRFYKRPEIASRTLFITDQNI